MKAIELISALELFDTDREIVLVCAGKDYPTGDTDRVMEDENNTVIILAAE